MIERIVTNTSPLIAIAKMQAADIIGKLPFEFVCPVQVEAELIAGKQPGQQFDIPQWLKVLPLKSTLSPLAIAALDVGEAAVIQLALEQNIKLVCIDELKGRRAALAVNLRVVGSLGLLGKAKILGLISNAGSFIERARNAGIYYNDELIETFLNSLGE